MGRRVWSDPKVIALSQRFVPVADEVWRLQRENDPECRFFRRTVTGKEDLHTGTMQGTYVLSAGGTLLARRNTNSPEAVVTLLEEALLKWDALPLEAKRLKDNRLVASGFRWEELYPEDGLALRRTARDLPADGNPDSEPMQRFNREAVWLSAAEAKSLVPDSSEVGARQAWPRALAQRFGCLVFVDNARGQTIPYHPDEDAGSELWSEVTGLEGSLLAFTIHGKTAAQANGPWLFREPNDWIPKESRRYPHSIWTEVRGAALYNLDAQEFVTFEILALGQRKGRTINNGRGGTDEDVNGVGFVCELAPADWRIAPTFIDVYGASWADPHRDVREE